MAATETEDDGAVEAHSLPTASDEALGTLDFLSACEAVAPRLEAVTGLPTWHVLRRHDDELVVLTSVHSSGATPIGPGATVDGTPIARWADGDEPLCLPDARRHDGGLGALVRLPLGRPGHDGFGYVIGSSSDPHPDPDALARSMPAATTIVDLLGVVLDLDLDRSRLQRRLDAAESVALSDELTGLGNRRAFDRAIAREEARCRRFGHRAGIAMVDLDGLKAVNDTKGHDAGDALLRRTADALLAAVRDADQGFRLGGDEFALLLPELSAERLGCVRRRLVEHLEGAGVAASVGIAIRDVGGDLHTATAAADLAMYAQKRARRSR